jgi:glycosyltransferase involved in cell wall biosynthesis
MNLQSLRVAFFPDAYYEVDGVANTSRQFAAFAKRRDLPMLAVHAAAGNRDWRDGSVQHIERKRKWPSFYLDKNHDFDLLYWRYYQEIKAAAKEFQPDVVHITGPSDLGIMGALLAHQLQVPLAASWHTNVHEYAEMRALKWMRGIPSGWQTALGAKIRAGSFLATARFYQIARLLFAPNPELVRVLEESTRKPCSLMGRGVDTILFDGTRRNRSSGPFTIGYVGRITVEKDVRFLVELERALLAAGEKDFRFMIVGQGAEESWLRENLRQADFTGVLKGEMLAAAYANMDVFAFPSRTDTFGNVVLEALASGVPAVVTNEGGPKFIVRPGETGFVAADSAEFTAAIRRLMADTCLRGQMRNAARASALSVSWDAVFEKVYAAYERGLSPNGRTVKPLSRSPRISPATLAH